MPDQYKNNLNTLCELHKQYFDAFDKRRSYEWKMSLSLWMGLGTMTGFLSHFKVSLNFFGFVKLPIIYTGVALIYYFAWCVPIAQRQIQTIKEMNWCREYIDILLLAKKISTLQQKPTTKYFEGLIDFAAVTKALFTILILYLSWAIIVTG